MIPILYEKSETRFASNGLGRLVDCISCEVTEERNGIYECEFQYPVNGRHYEDIIVGRIIFCTHDDTRTGQPFDIYKRSAVINGVVTFSACHISYRLSTIVVRPYEATSCALALSRIRQNSLSENPFTFSTDKQLNIVWRTNVPIRIKEMLGGSDNSILDVYGPGEYEWDKFEVKFNLYRGEEKDIEIRYGKNLTDLTDEIDFNNTYNAVVPYWVNPDGNEMLVLPEYVVMSPEAVATIEPWTDDLSNIITDQDGTNLEFAYAETKAIPLDLSEYFLDGKPSLGDMRVKAGQILSQRKAWVPSENIEVDFVQLWQTPEYEDVAPLQRVNLCDTVSVVHPDLGINVRIKVIKTVYDVLLDRYSAMELGTPQTSFADIITKGALTQARVEFATESKVLSTVERFAQGISGAYGGHVVTIYDENMQPMETLWMDTADTETAQNVIKINKLGIGFSTTGYNGPYTNAWTIDGTLNADFIKAGTLVADIIKSGKLSSLDGSTYFDLDTGYYGSSDGRSGVYLKGKMIRFRQSTLDPASAALQSDIMRICALNKDDPVYDIDEYGDMYVVYERAGMIHLPLGNTLYIAANTYAANATAIVKINPSNYSGVRTAHDTAIPTQSKYAVVELRGGTVVSGGLLIEYGAFRANGNARFDAKTTFDGEIYIGRNATLTTTGDVVIENTSQVTGATANLTVSDGDLYVGGNTTLHGNLTADRGATIGGTTNTHTFTAYTANISSKLQTGQNATSTFNGTATFNKSVTFNGNVEITSTFNLDDVAMDNLTVNSVLSSDLVSARYEGFRLYDRKDRSKYYTVRASDDIIYIDYWNSAASIVYGGNFTLTSMQGYKHHFSGMVYVEKIVNCISVTQRSDERLKNFQEWDDAYDEILDHIEPRQFQWKDEDDTRTHIGLSAQELQRAISDAGIENCGFVETPSNGDDPLSVNYNDVMMLMLSRIKKLEARIADLERRLNADT